MSTPISDTFLAQLQQMRSDLIARLRAQRGGTLGRPEAASANREVVGDDWAKANEEIDLKIGLEELESAELVAIDAALKRVADGSYGLCVQCGASIPAARLHANPIALRCISCQTDEERHNPTPHANL
jgi:DnaK suppressor protein